MGNPRSSTASVLVAALGLLLGACATDEAAETTPTEATATEAADDMAEDMSDEHDDDEGHDDFAFGAPADAADADRTVAIEAGTGFVFDPAEVTVAAGETVTFEVTNSDTIEHDFTLGDEAAQDEHEEEMRAMDDADGEMGHAEANAVVVPAGETASITWTFTEPGTVIYGCHQPGHYDADMRGEVIVEG